MTNTTDSMAQGTDRNAFSSTARRKQKIRRTGLILFLVYLALLFYFLFFAEWYDRAPARHTGYSANLMPFREIGRYWHARARLPGRVVFLNLLGNVIGFLPFGFFLPVIDRRLMRRGVLVILLGALLSLCVELIQLITLTGSFDVDDILLNTLGTALGYLLFRILNTLIRRADILGEKNKNGGKTKIHFFGKEEL